MLKVTVREARQHIGRLLDAVATGEEIIITRRGQPAARLLDVPEKDKKIFSFPDRRSFRHKLPPAQQPGSQLIQEMRHERG